MLVSVVLSALLGQLLVLHVPMIVTFYISIGTSAAAALLCWALPADAELLLLAHKDDPPVVVAVSEPAREPLRVRARKIVGQVLSAYREPTVLWWSLWGVLVAATHTLAMAYYPTLFATAAPSLPMGLVMGVAYAAGATMALAPAFVMRPLARVLARQDVVVAAAARVEGAPGASMTEQPAATRLAQRMERALTAALKLVSALMPALLGLLLVLLGGASAPGAAFALLVVYQACSELLSPIAAAQMCARVPAGRYAGVLGLNILVAMAAQLVLQAVMSRHALALSVRAQFAALGFVLWSVAAIGLIAFVTMLFVHCGCCRRRADTESVPLIARELT
jgi:hypothetical protein